MSMKTQHQIKSNAEDLQDYLQDLYKWEAAIKKKDEELRQKKRNADDQATKPVKKVQMLSVDEDATRTNIKNEEPAENKVPTPVSTDSVRAPPSDDVSKQHRLQEAIIQKDKGNDYFKQSKYSEAITCYSRAMELDPSSAILPANRAMAYLKQNKFKEAEADCTQSLKLDPTYLKAYHRRGCSRAQLGKLTEAQMDFEKVLSVEPHNKAAEQELNNLKTKLASALKPQVTQQVPKAAPKAKPQQVQRDLSHLFITEQEIQVTEQKQSSDIKNLMAVPVKTARSDAEEEEHIRAIFSEWKNASKVEKATAQTVLAPEEIKLPPVPKTSIQFENDWKKLGTNLELKSEYLKQIPPARIAGIFRDAMDSDILAGILSVLSTKLANDEPLLSDWLANLAQVKRIGAVALFLTQQQKTELKDLLKKFKGTREEEETLRKKFGV